MFHSVCPSFCANTGSHPGQARMTYEQALSSKRAKDFRSFHKQITQSSDLLFQALQESEQAVKTWTALVVDPTDLGTLAGLNSYGHDWLVSARPHKRRFSCLINQVLPYRFLMERILAQKIIEVNIVQQLSFASSFAVGAITIL